MSNLLKAVQEPRRQRALQLIWDRERAAGDIHRAMGDLSFGAVSQHLAVLREAGLVDVRRDGRRRLYRARREAFGPLADWLEQMWSDALLELRRLAEAEDPS